MNLITQIISPSLPRLRSNSTRSSQGGNRTLGNGNANGLARSDTTSGGLARRDSKRKVTKKDADGWQTVVHKK
jgi:hypothetical protein